MLWRYSFQVTFNDRQCDMAALQHDINKGFKGKYTQKEKEIPVWIENKNYLMQ